MTDTLAYTIECVRQCELSGGNDEREQRLHTAHEACRRSLAAAFRSTGSGSNVLQCLLLHARVLRAQGRLKDAIAAFEMLKKRMSNDDQQQTHVQSHEHTCCMMELHMPRLYADIVEYDKVARSQRDVCTLKIYDTEPCDITLVGFPWVRKSIRQLEYVQLTVACATRAANVFAGEFNKVAADLGSLKAKGSVEFASFPGLEQAAVMAAADGCYDDAIVLLKEVIAASTDVRYVAWAAAEHARMLYLAGRIEEACKSASTFIGCKAMHANYYAVLAADDVTVACHMRLWTSGKFSLELQSDSLSAFLCLLVGGDNQLAAIVSPYVVRRKPGNDSGNDSGSTLPLSSSTIPRDDDWIAELKTSCRLNNDDYTAHDYTVDDASRHVALRACNAARIAERANEWVEAERQWNTALGAMCSIDVLRSLDHSMLGMEVFTLLYHAEDDGQRKHALFDAWACADGQKASLDFDALVAGRITFGKAVKSDSEVLRAMVDRSFTAHTAHMRAAGGACYGSKPV